MTAPILRLLTRLIVLAVLLTGSLRAEDVFEGIIRYNLTTGKKPLEMTHFIKGTRMRIELPLKGDTTAASIVDLDTRTIIVLMPDQRMFMSMDIPDVSSDPSETSGITFEDTGESREILGYPCVRYLLNDGKRTVDVWATTGLGPFFGSSNPMTHKNSRSIWETQLAEAGLFPLHVLETDRKGKVVSSLEVTAIEPGPLADTLFERPEGYQELALPSLGGMPFGR